MDRLLFDQLGRETSPSRANRILRAIEDQFTPVELARLLPEFARLTGPAREVCDKSDILRELRHRRPQPFERQVIAPDVVFYSAPGGVAAQKSLIIALCGRSHRLMTCWSLFLQFMPADQFDVLIIADRSNDHFFSGVVGYAPDLYGLVKRATTDVDPARYARTYCYGTSTGGFPALRFGLLMGAYRSVSVGGMLAWHIHRLKTGVEFQAFDPLCTCDWPKRGQMVCVHAEGVKIDANAAIYLQHLMGVSRVPIAGSTSHNVVYEFYKAGRLASFYRQVFDFRRPLSSSPQQVSRPGAGDSL